MFRGKNKVFIRDERWRKRREWWKQSGRKSIKKNPKTSWAVCLSQQQSEKLIREKKMWVGKHSTERGDRCRNRERRDSERAREEKKDKRMNAGNVLQL